MGYGDSLSAGTNTPPAIAATPVTAIPPPIGVNGYSSVPAPANGQQATEALYTNGVHPYQGTSPSKASKNTEMNEVTDVKRWMVCFCSHLAQSPAALDPLQQAYAGMQHYTGRCSSFASFMESFSLAVCFLGFFWLFFLRKHLAKSSQVKVKISRLT